MPSINPRTGFLRHCSIVSPRLRVSCRAKGSVAFISTLTTYSHTPQAVSKHQEQHGLLQSPLNDSRRVRRPLLNSVHQIDSIRDLIPFFSQVSMTSYESVYTSCGNVDWEAVEDGLFQDMFDGR